MREGGREGRRQGGIIWKYEPIYLPGFHMYDGDLYKNERYIRTQPPDSVFSQFIDFLRDCGHDRVVLVSHGNHYFDLPILFYHLEKHGLLEELNDIVIGFLDTYPLLKQVIYCLLK